MDRKLAETIGAAAREARKGHRWTQQDTAERIGVSVEFYARIERGVTLPSAPTLVSMGEALGVSLDTLVGRTPAALLNERVEPRVKAPEPVGSPAMRRLVRRLRSAKPSTVRLLALMAAALERRR